MTTHVAFRAQIDLDNELTAEQAYAQALPQLQALPPRQMIPVNLSIPSVVTRVLGALPIRAEIGAEADLGRTTRAIARYAASFRGAYWASRRST